MKKPELTILFDANPLMVQRTGVGHYTSRLVEQLATDHPELQLVGYYYNFLGRKPRPRDPSAPNISYRGIFCVPGPLVNLLRRWHILLPLELLTLRQADFIFYPNYLGLSSLFKTPSATVIHDLTFIDLPEYVAPRNLRDLQSYIPAQIRRSDFLVTVSEFSKRRIGEEFAVPTEDIVVTPIPPGPLQPADPEADKTLLADLGITGKYILTLGTVEPRKNLLNMLDAYLRLPDKLQREYMFVVAGKIGWNCDAEVARLKQLRRAGKHILHIGYVTDKQRAALYRSASLFTSASFYEGFGMPALEAMSFGVPCAISDIPVFREVAGDAARYFDQERLESITATWQGILNDRSAKKRLSSDGRARAATYRWSAIAASLYSRIAQTLQERNHG